jgi:CRP/FNR family transcriptional regulator, cyclic AMP receptor protein
MARSAGIWHTASISQSFRRHAGQRISCRSIPEIFCFVRVNPPRALYVVKRGTLRVVSGSTVYEMIKPGGIVGEMGIVEERGLRSASVIAGTRSELIEIDTQKFLALVSEYPDFSLAVMRVMSHRLRVMNQRYRGKSTA